MADDPLRPGERMQPRGVAEGVQPTPAAAPGQGLRVAVSSSKGGLHAGWIWGLTCLIVLAGGVTLHAARAAVGATLDRWVPRIEPPVPDVPPEPPAAVPVPEPSIEGVVEPEWTYVDIEAAIRPLPENTEALISEGRDELSQFTDLNSADEARALLIRNRWRLWGRIWHNRVDHVRGPMPPAEVCDIHAALEPTCRAVRESLSMLAEVPSVDRVGEARELLDGAAAILEQLRQAQAEELEEASSSPEFSDAATPSLDSGVP